MNGIFYSIKQYTFLFDKIINKFIMNFIIYMKKRNKSPKFVKLFVIAFILFLSIKGIFEKHSRVKAEKLKVNE